MNAVWSRLYGVIFLLIIATIQPVCGFCQVQKDPVAENMLLYQRFNGGWAKAFKGIKITYNHNLNRRQIAQIKRHRFLKDATIDNNATTREINYLLNAFRQTNNAAYLMAAEKGLDYLLSAQYENGGWPQYYPDSSLYRAQVTFNDNAIINVLRLLNKVSKYKGEFAAVQPKYIRLCQVAVNKGIDCIVNTQVIVNGKRTVWNQQYNNQTLLPESARSFELVGLASAESAAIVLFLMKIPHPSAVVKETINSAMDWFKKVAIKGYSFEHSNEHNKMIEPDALLVKSRNSTIWARFYEIGTNRPFFSGRNSVKKYNLKEIEIERRVGYAWYGSWPEKLIKSVYPDWLLKYGD